VLFLYPKKRREKGNNEFLAFAVKEVVDYFNSQADSTDKNGHITEDDVFMVWCYKTL
jgi:hypothetical protein